MRWFVFAVVLLEACEEADGRGSAECDPYDPSAPGLDCEMLYICCEGDTHCWTETDSGKRYEMGQEENAICDACDVGAYTGAALGC